MASLVIVAGSGTWLDDLDVGNVTDTGNVTDLATLPRKAKSMTFSPIMSAAVSDQGTGPSQPEPESATKR